MPQIHSFAQIIKPIHMKQKFLFLFALLCAIVQGAWAQTDRETPLTLEAKTAGMIVINYPKSGMQYSVNGGEKTAVSTDYTQFVINDVAIGDKVEFYGTGTSLTSYAFSQIKGTAEYYVYGNIMSLVDEYNFATATTLTSESAFATLFQENAKVFNHPTRKLVLPATTLTNKCYEQMFFRCTNLTEAPVLPATTLKDDCYKNMFAGCTKLNSMTCYATSLATSATSYWLYDVAATGTFVKANEMESWSTGKDGIPSGWTVKNVFTYVTTEEELNNAITGGANIIKLTENIVLSNYLGIENGVTATIDLNGHTLSRNSDTSDDYGSVIRVEEGGTLTVKDSSGNNSGKISGGKSTNGGGINNHGTLYFQGGTITGCSATNGGGIFNAPSTVDATPATLTMTGGVIDGCSAVTGGGGIYNYAGSTVTIDGGIIDGCSANNSGGIYNAGTMTFSSGEVRNCAATLYVCGGIGNDGNLTISGGTISGNRSAWGGGGVLNNENATLTMTGGTITGNHSDTYGGGGVFNYGTLNMKGKPIVSGNNSTANGIDNVYLNGSSVITVTGAFTEGAKIGVRPASTSNAITSNYSTYNQGTTPDNFFSSDAAFHKMSLNGSGDAILKGAAGKWIDYKSEEITHKDGNTWYIESPEDLAHVAYHVQAGSSNYLGITFVLNTDLDMSAHFWTPIGTDSNHPFKGNFDGNGHTISGVYVNSTGSHNGLFGYVEGTITLSNTFPGCDFIKDFVLKNSYIKGGDRTGGVVGYIRRSMTLENVVCQADVTGGANVGGIVGDVIGDIDYVYIRNCLFLSGKITSTGISAAVIGNIRDFVSCSNNYYIDPTSYVGNDNDVRAYPITMSIPEGVTVNYTSSGVTYDGIRYAPVGDVNFTVSHDLNHIVTVEVNGDELVSSEGNYSFTIDPATTEAYEIKVTAGTYSVNGSGTEAEPYRIASQEDWNHFGNYLNSGLAPNDFSGAHFKLTADNITVNQRMGTNDHPFCGTFDGNSHTLTLAFGTSENYSDKECAPFYSLKNAIIKNLVIDGSIYSSAQHNAGIAVTVKGQNNYIQNCVSSVSIYSNRSGSGDDGDCTNGGFIGIHKNGSKNICDITFEGCAFTGELVGANAKNWGGFIGWRVYGKDQYCDVHFTNCLFAPKTVNIATPDGSNSRTFCRYSNSAGAYYTKCYYTEPLQGADGGKQAYGTTTAPANIGAEGTEYNVSGITTYGNGLLYGGRYYTDCIGFYDNASNTDLLNDLGTTYEGKQVNVTLTGRTLYRDGYWNTLCLPFDVELEGSPLKVAEARTLSSASFNAGTLTLNFSEPVTTLNAGTPYIIKWNKTDLADLVIKTTADWDAFASAVNGGNNYSGKTVLLTNDIDVETMVGTKGNKFKGTFDGNGHKLTFTATSEQYCAPFHYVENATIMNLHTAGSITTSAKFGAGLVGYTKGTTVINNCWSSVSIISSVSGDGSHGGFVGYTEENASNTTLTDCLFDGSITGENTNSCGGLIGWNYDKATLTNCVFRPTSITLANSDNATFSRGSNVTVTNCYFSEELPGASGQGTAIGGMTEKALLSALGSGWTESESKVAPIVTKASGIINPVFNGVTINATASTTTTPTDGDSDGKVSFIGNYNPVELPAGDASNLYLGAGNQLYWPNKNRTMGAFRGYFNVNLGGDSQVRAFRLNFDGETATGVSLIDNGQWTMDNYAGADEWYNLDGRKLNDKPSQKGIYIHGGKKVVVK